jgi:hypothetical protein
MQRSIPDRPAACLLFSIHGVRTAPVAIHGPPGTRMRKIGFVHEEGALDSVPENEALPCALSVTGDVSVTVGELLALQTSAPVTFVTGPGVPLALPPLITSPSTLNATSPVMRLTKAKPPVVVHGELPLAIPPTGLETAGAVITPVMVFQNTTLLLWPTAIAVAVAHTNTTANTFFIGF